MEPWGTPALTVYSYKDFPSSTSQNHLLLRKNGVTPDTGPSIS